MFKTSLPYILILAFTVNLTFCWGYTVQREESAMVMPAFFYLGNEGPEGENPESPSLPAEECELSTGEILKCVGGACLNLKKTCEVRKSQKKILKYS